MNKAEETFPLRGDCPPENLNKTEEVVPLHETNNCENGNAVGYLLKLEKGSFVSEKDYDQDNEKRGEWGSKIEFFLAIMGYTVGIGSVWRFPITCSRNGGGAFLIPFFFFLVTSGGPLYYMEVCLGQFTGKSAGLAFEFCPLLKGVGPLQVVLSLIVIWYSIFVLAWTFYFLYNSFFPTLPWTTCGNTWNTPNCQATADLWTTNTTAVLSYTKETSPNDSFNLTLSGVNITQLPLKPSAYSSSAFEFWQYNVVGRSAGLEDLGGLQIHLVICSFLSWVFVVLAVLKGAKTLGKVVYVTATVPFLFLGIMLIRGLTLDGALEGIIAFVKPDFSKLLTFQVWLEAAIQVFYSLGPTWGGVITMASYNKFHQQSFWTDKCPEFVRNMWTADQFPEDALSIPQKNPCVSYMATTLCVASVGFTSFFNGLVVFTILGFMAKEAGMEVQEVASASGPGLAFVAFPTALSHMPLPQLWSVLFFLMLITVVFDSLFGMFETVTCGIIDVFPQQLTSKRVLVNIISGLVFFLLGLPLTLNGGIYIFQLADWYFASFSLLIGSALEAIGICWIYGTDRFSKDIEMMTGRYVSVLLRIMWSIVIPVFVIITFIILLTRYTTPNYGDGYDYPTHSIVIAVSIGLSPIVVMVGVAIKETLKTQGGIKQRIKQLLKPTYLWQPNDHVAKEKYRLQPYVYTRNAWKYFRLNAVGPKDNPMF